MNHEGKKIKLKKQPSPVRDSVMVTRLRRKFITTAMICLLIIVVLMIAVINIANFSQIERSAADTLQVLSENNGTFPTQSAEDGDTLPEQITGDDDILPEQTPGDDNTLPEQMTGDDNTLSEQTPENDGVSPAQASEDDGTSLAQMPEDNRTGAAAVDPEPSGESGHKPRRFPEMDIAEARRIEEPFETRYFSVVLNADGEVTGTDIGHIAAVTADTAQEYALTVYYNSRTSGYAFPYRYGAYETEEGGLLVIFVDCSSSLSAATQLLVSSLCVGAAALVLMFILVCLFAGRAVSPVVESLEKQKRFISDAGHELKTPITVISANVDVLELTGGQNEWTDSIRGQIRRLTDLIGNMLTLSRMEEDAAPVVFTDVDFSALVRETAKSFEAVAQAAGLDYSVAIPDGFHVRGDAGSLQQLCTVLLDNAMKYTSWHGSVYLLVHGEGKASSDNENGRSRALSGLWGKGPRVVLEVTNTCDAIPEGNLDRLFDRFYRADSSRSRSGRSKPRAPKAGFRLESAPGREKETGLRPATADDFDAGTGAIFRGGQSRTDDAAAEGNAEAGNEENNRRDRRAAQVGGYGIGLSVAKAVSEAHGGAITAVADGDHLIRFIVSLPAM